MGAGSELTFVNSDPAALASDLSKVWVGPPTDATLKKRIVTLSSKR
jgi:hypothetical protein